ncbi:uncharacterized protein PG998_013834 [Apiospora kogelbergensis]|uniref:Uncharacterized protein n=1 Tax=Apiospora kogelbergensis TaxID=1337665 RepID=A0AAW0R079_9PEZI
MIANDRERNGSGGRPLRFMNGARPDAVPSVSEKVGGTGLRTPPLAGATSKRNVQTSQAQAVYGQ